MKILAQRLRELRKEKKLNQTIVAQNLGLEYYTLGKLEQGRAEPSAEDLTKLADFFNCSVDYLLGREDDFGNIVINFPAAPVLTEEEKRLLTAFRKLVPNMKSFMLANMEMLAAQNG